MVKNLPKQESVPIRTLRLSSEAGKETSYDSKPYQLKDVSIFPPESVLLLLSLHPIYVVRNRRIYEVVAGTRIFHLAAECLEPDSKIPVLVIPRPVNKEYLRVLRYHDLALTPLVLSHGWSAADLYRHIESSDQVIFSRLFSSKRSFAKALGIVPSALSNEAKKFMSKRVEAPKEELLK